MSKSSIAARVLPVVVVAAVLALSLVSRPVGISGVNAALCGSGYGYGTTPAVDAVSPAMGSTAGGTSVTLTGCGFTGATSVHFGATAGTSVVVVSDTTITVTSPAHAAGTVDVSVTTNLGTSPAQAGDHFTYIAPGTACTGVTINAAPPSVVQHSTSGGTHVIATASATGCPSPLYEFWLRPASNPNWQMVQGYSTSNSYNWNSTGALPGTVYLGVHAKDAGSSNAFDQVASTPVTITAAACGGVTISASPNPVNNDPNRGGTIVTATAVASSCSTTPLYEFWLRAASDPIWHMVQAYSATATYNWDSSGALPGTVYIGVHAKDAQSTADFDAVQSTPEVVNASQCTGVTITPVPNTVVHSNTNGTHVIATASASGCTNSPLYEFWLRPASDPNWKMVQGYSTTPTYNWNSTGALPGTVYIGVHVKDVNSVNSNGYDVVQSAAVTVT